MDDWSSIRRTMCGMQVLDLSHNRLTTFLLDLPLLYRLQELRLGSNNIREIPKDISKMKNLVKLDLSDNYLTQLPDTLIKLSALKELNLTSNMLLQWPTNFVKIQERVTVSDMRSFVSCFIMFIIGQSLYSRAFCQRGDAWRALSASLYNEDLGAAP